MFVKSYEDENFFDKEYNILNSVFPSFLFLSLFWLCTQPNKWKQRYKECCKAIFLL